MRTTSTRPGRLEGSFRQVGRRAVARVERWFGPLIKRVFYVLAFDVLARDMTKPVPAHPTHPDLSVRRISADETPWWDQTLPRKRVATIRAALADGDIGCVALVGDTIVGEVWATRKTKGDVRVRLASDEAYTYGLLTDPRYRALGTGYAVMAGMMSAVQHDWPVSVLYTYTDRRKRESQVLLRTFCGFHQVQRARRVRILRRWGFVIPGSAEPAYGPLCVSREHGLTHAARG